MFQPCLPLCQTSAFSKSHITGERCSPVPLPPMHVFLAHFFVTSGIWLAQGFPVAHVHWQCDPALAEQFCWNGFPIACNGRSTVPMQAASQNALSWKWPTRIIESTLYVNGPYGDWTHNLGVLSTMLWPTEPICENWQEMHVHPKFLKGEVAVALGNVKATEKPGMRD